MYIDTKVNIYTGKNYKVRELQSYTDKIVERYQAK
jgi:hypothetical protein